MKKYILILLFGLIATINFGQGTITDPWVKKGNSLSNNTSVIGSTNSRSFKVITNNTEIAKFDSVGRFRYSATNPVFKVLSTNTGSSNINLAVVSTSLPGMWFNQTTPTSANATILYNTPSSTTNYNSVGNGSIVFNTNSTKRFKIDSLGLFISGTPTYTDNNIWSMYQGSNNNYYQSIWQNTSNGVAASTDLVLSNDLGTASSYYTNLGMNSSTFTGTTVFDLKNGGYLYNQSGPLSLGTRTTQSIYLSTNNVDRLKVDSVGKVRIANQLSFAQSEYTASAVSDIFRSKTTVDGITIRNDNATYALTLRNGTKKINMYYDTTASNPNGQIGVNGGGLGIYGSGGSQFNFCSNGYFSMSNFTATAVMQFKAGTAAFPEIALPTQTTYTGTTGGMIWHTSPAINFNGGILSRNSFTAGIGYGAGTGSTVTQATSRTTGVTINSATGAITLFSAAGQATYQSFTVTNSAVAATDVVVVSQKSGTDLNIVLVTAVSAGSFRISFATTGGTTVEQPVFNFAVIKGSSN